MDWRKRYNEPILIKNIDQLKPGDLVFYVDQNDKKCYTIIHNIVNNMVWGYWSRSKEEVIDQKGSTIDLTWMSTCNPKYPIFKVIAWK